MASKELLIVFVYDLESTQTEFDDPYGAIKYFYPSFVSSIQQMAITGQLVGFQNWCEDSFDKPQIIKLCNGLFVLRKFGRFMLAIGSDRNISETISLYRTELITNILNFYYGGIETLFDQLDDKQKFSEILLNIFETYLPSIQYYGNLLNSCFRFILPKSSSNLYVNACQIIENLTLKKEIIGGMIAYRNKVLVSHLSQNLSKVLIISDPFRVKNHVEENLNFRIPSAMRIVKVFISNSEYDRLRKSKETVSESLYSRNVTLPLNFSIRKKVMKEKREKNFKFSNIPEEEALADPQDKIRIRPCNLPLKLKTFRPEPGKISFGEYDSYSDFIGKTSVACTPLAENKIFCGPVGSIFTEHDTQSTSTKNENVKQAPPIFKPVIIQYYSNPMRSQITCKKSWNDLTAFEFEIDEGFDCNKNYNTISDPLCPYFDERKRPMSKSLFQLFEIDADDIPNIKAKNTFHPVAVESNDANCRGLETINLTDIAKDPPKPSIHQRKKMMRLPIKSITSTALVDNDSGRPSTSSISDASTFDSPKSRKYSLQLTPLMAKLTSLALLDNDLTPNFTPVDILSVSKKLTSATVMTRLLTEEAKEDVKIDCKDIKKLDLLIYCQNNTKLAIIGEENFFSENEAVVQSIFDLCNNRLSKLEQKLNNSVDATTEINSDYSFMNIGQLWDIRKRGGSFNHTDIHDIHLINSMFNKKLFSDVILYDGFDGSLLYGNSKFEESETYYKCNSQKVLGGLPAPFSDFDIVKVRKLLENDQSMVLF